MGDGGLTHCYCARGFCARKSVTPAHEALKNWHHFPECLIRDTSYSSLQNCDSTGIIIHMDSFNDGMFCLNLLWSLYQIHTSRRDSMHLCSGFTRVIKFVRFLAISWISRILISCVSISGVLDGSRWLVTSRRKIKIRQKNTHTLPISSDEKLARHPDNRLGSGWQDGSSYRPHFLSTSVCISTSMMLQIEDTGRLATGSINSEFKWCRLKCCPNRSLASSWKTATVDRKHGSAHPCTPY